MDEKIEKSIHDLESVLAEGRKHIFRATVLDRDNQPLATGKALTVDGAPIFWPDSPLLVDIQPPNLLKLRHSDGTEIPIMDFRECPAPSSSLHYHFRLE